MCVVLRAFESRVCIGSLVSLPGPGDALLLLHAPGQHAVGVGVELDAVALVVAPFVLLVGVVEVEVTRHLLPEAESSGALGGVLRPVQLGLDDGILGAPGVGEVNVLEVNRLKAVLPSCVTIADKERGAVSKCVEIFLDPFLKRHCVRLPLHLMLTSALILLIAYYDPSRAVVE